jgi:hypothetical protein
VEIVLGLRVGHAEHGVGIGGAAHVGDAPVVAGDRHRLRLALHARLRGVAGMGRCAAQQANDQCERRGGDAGRVSRRAGRGTDRHGVSPSVGKPPVLTHPVALGDSHHAPVGACLGNPRGSAATQVVIASATGRARASGPASHA